MTAIRCSKCDSVMQPGFLVDRTDSQTDQAAWAAGAMWSFMLYDEPTVPVTTFRCVNCGYLESYAKPAAQKSSDDRPQDQQVDQGESQAPQAETASSN